MLWRRRPLRTPPGAAAATAATPLAALPAPCGARGQASVVPSEEPLQAAAATPTAAQPWHQLLDAAGGPQGEARGHHGRGQEEGLPRAAEGESVPADGGALRGGGVIGSGRGGGRGEEEEDHAGEWNIPQQHSPQYTSLLF